eukprot:6189599-Pleurochrysis_carterae.AAC.7
MLTPRSVAARWQRAWRLCRWPPQPTHHRRNDCAGALVCAATAAAERQKGHAQPARCRKHHPRPLPEMSHTLAAA